MYEKYTSSLCDLGQAISLSGMSLTDSLRRKVKSWIRWRIGCGWITMDRELEAVGSEPFQIVWPEASYLTRAQFVLLIKGENLQYFNE